MELLTVIGIIGLFVALLLPTLGKARTQAREVQCAATLRAWGQAFYNYATVYKGRLPHSGDRSSNPALFKDMDYPPLPQNNCGYTDVLPPLMNRKPWSSYPQGQRPTGDIWQCPVTQFGATDVYGYDPTKLGYHTYVMNTYLDYVPTTPPAGYKKLPSFMMVGDARQQSMTLLMFEGTVNPSACNGQQGVGAAACTAGEYAHDGPGNFSDRHAHVRGKLGGHLMMLDGHVEWADHLWETSLPPSGMPPISDRRWWPY